MLVLAPQVMRWSLVALMKRIPLFLHPPVAMAAVLTNPPFDDVPFNDGWTSASATSTASIVGDAATNASLTSGGSIHQDFAGAPDEAVSSCPGSGSPQGCQHSPMQAKQGYEEKFSHIGNKSRRTIAAMMMSQEEAVARIFATLEDKGLEDNTIIWLLNDNGGAGYAKFDNGPWRGTKGMLFEGSVRVAFAVRWLGVVPAGQNIDVPVSSVDIGATSLAAAGASLPPEFDGRDLRPLLHGKSRCRHRSGWRGTIGFPPTTGIISHDEYHIRSFHHRNSRPDSPTRRPFMTQSIRPWSHARALPRCGWMPQIRRSSEGEMLNSTPCFQSKIAPPITLSKVNFRRLSTRQASCSLRGPSSERPTRNPCSAMPVRMATPAVPAFAWSLGDWHAISAFRALSRRAGSPSCAGLPRD
jgi:hypothetical protein